MHLKFDINDYDYPITKNVIAIKQECVTIICSSLVQGRNQKHQIMRQCIF